MPRKLLFAVHFEVSFTIIYYYFVIHWLSSKVFAIRMHCSIGDGLHIWFTDVLGHNRDSKLPQVNFFIICSRHKSSTSLYESDSVDWTHMLLILLSDFTCIGIVLKNFFVCTACQKNILSIITRMKFHAEWCLSISEAFDNLSSFCIPKLDNLVESST